MDIATVKARMTEFFGKDDMYRMPLGVVMEDWLVAEHDRLTSDLTSAKEEIERLRERDRRITAQLKQSCDDARAAQPWDEEVMACEQIVEMQAALTSERKETERLRRIAEYAKHTSACPAERHHGVAMYLWVNRPPIAARGGVMGKLERGIIETWEKYKEHEPRIEDLCLDVQQDSLCYGIDCVECPLSNAKYLVDLLKAQEAPCPK